MCDQQRYNGCEQKPEVVLDGNHYCIPCARGELDAKEDYLKEMDEEQNEIL